MALVLKTIVDASLAWAFKTEVILVYRNNYRVVGLIPLLLQ